MYAHATQIQKSINLKKAFIPCPYINKDSVILVILIENHLWAIPIDYIMCHVFTCVFYVGNTLPTQYKRLCLHSSIM